jgi:3-phosphoshikimate 1-carboxyvinyltransferase
MDFRVTPSRLHDATITVPGDKSISHRALMLGSIAEGRTDVSGFLSGEDCLATAAAMRALGVTIEQPDATSLLIQGVGRDGLQAPDQDIDLGNSGTAMRLMAGLLAGQRFSCTLTGDESLTGRPMGRIIKPLTLMGAAIESDCDGTPPLQLSGGLKLHAIDYDLPIASAQVKSALLLAGLYAEGRTSVTEPAVTRDHTERRWARTYPLRTALSRSWAGRICEVARSRFRGTCHQQPS